MDTQDVMSAPFLLLKERFVARNSHFKEPPDAFDDALVGRPGTAVVSQRDGHGILVFSLWGICEPRSVRTMVCQHLIHLLQSEL